MEKLTFANPAVRERLADFRLLQADVTGNTDEDRALLRRFGLYGPPGIAFFAPRGGELAQFRLVGYKDPESFLEHIEQIM
jgi:thiol:disulfide interchange protein DsbD